MKEFANYDVDKIIELSNEEFDDLNLSYSHEETENYFVIDGIDNTLYVNPK